MSQEIAIMDTITIARPPELVLEEAHKAAAALKKILDAKPKKVMMNGEQYLEFEDWQTVGKFYGVTVKVESTAPVEFGTARGFEAVASVLRADGQEVSRAEAMCLDDEEKWSARTKYEVVDGVRTPVGKIPVPLFQLRSMAQTRACAKALRNVLAWVVVLAGYKPTPAEEMDGVPGVKTTAGTAAPPSPQPPQAPQTATAAPKDLLPTVRTDPQGLPLCPVCEGPMFDNRAERKQAEAEIAAKTRTKAAPPAWKCRAYKSTGCKGMLWPSEYRTATPPATEEEPPVDDREPGQDG